MPKHLGEELVRGGQVLLAVTEENTGTGVECGPGHFGDECRLAQAGFTRDDDHFAGPAARHPFESSGDRFGLGAPPDNADIGCGGEPSWQRYGSGAHLAYRLPQDLHRFDGFGQTLERELTQGSALVAAPASGHGADEVGRQDLTGVAMGTETGRLRRPGLRSSRRSRYWPRPH